MKASELRPGDRIKLLKPIHYEYIDIWKDHGRQFGILKEIPAGEVLVMSVYGGHIKLYSYVSLQDVRMSMKEMEEAEFEILR